MRSVADLSGVFGSENAFSLSGILGTRPIYDKEPFMKKQRKVPSPEEKQVSPAAEPGKAPLPEVSRAATAEAQAFPAATAEAQTISAATADASLPEASGSATVAAPSAPAETAAKPKLTHMEKVERVVFWIVLVSLIGTFIYNLVGVFVSPKPGHQEAFDKTTEDYVLTLLMCSFTLFVIFLPSILNKAFKMVVPTFMNIVFIIFLYCASYLGEARDFFYKIPDWDVYLHTCSSAMLGALGFSVVFILNKDRQLNLNPFFVFLFSLCFAFALGAFWEIIEYVLDVIFHTNSQKFMTEDGIPFVGQAALKDTMEDLMIDFCGAFTMSLIGLISLRKKGKVLSNLLIGFEDSDVKPIDALRGTAVVGESAHAESAPASCEAAAPATAETGDKNAATATDETAAGKDASSKADKTAVNKK